MGMVYSTLDPEDNSLTEEDVAELKALDKRKNIDFSDIPERTIEQMRLGRLMAIEIRKRQMFSLRLQNSTINWWKENVGAGYTGVMARLLDKATEHPEWISNCL